MSNKLTRKLKRTIRRWLKNRTVVLASFAVLFVVGTAVYTGYIQNRRLTVKQATYAQLMQLIARAESNDNYNAYFGNASNTSIDFTKMSIAQVMTWQAEYVQKGSPSDAVGRYQIVSTTLSGLVRSLAIDKNTLFNAATQDRFAIALFERRGAESYVNKELTRDQFAANLAKEWAALPKVIGDNPGDSYYAGDGLNKSRVSVDEIIKAIEPISPK